MKIPALPQTDSVPLDAFEAALRDVSLGRLDPTAFEARLRDLSDADLNALEALIALLIEVRRSLGGPIASDVASMSDAFEAALTDLRLDKLEPADAFEACASAAWSRQRCES